jgi:hypothetical protein
MSDHPHQAKSQRRIYRAVSHWAHVSAIVAAGGKPDDDEIIFLLCLGEPVPPDVQAHLADRWAALLRAKGRGRPPKHPGQIEYDQLRKARDLFGAINKIRIGRRVSEAKACAEYAKAINKPNNAESVERQYRAAKKRMLLLIKRYDTGTTKWFLTAEDRDDWVRANLEKVAKNK